jgi:REP element-mobilizing transposase RayT
MASARKRHVQVEMTFRTWGGARPGAGRPAKGPRSSERHVTRPALKASEPVHVTLRVADDVRGLRKRHTYRAIRKATITTARREDFHLVHISIQGNHLHLLVEAHDRTALARGMQGFEISAAKHLNAAISRARGRRRKGAVFPDRYHARILKTPMSVRNGLGYVLNNWRKHGEDRGWAGRAWETDPFSSAWLFPWWKERAHEHMLRRPPPGYESLVVWRPKTWLLREGWRTHGGWLGLRDQPGPAA